MTPTHPIIEQGSVVQMKLLIGFNVTNLMTGDNVTEFEKITPETYEKITRSLKKKIWHSNHRPHKNKLMNGENVIDENFKKFALILN